MSGGLSPDSGAWNLGALVPAPSPTAEPPPTTPPPPTVEPLPTAQPPPTVEPRALVADAQPSPPLAPATWRPQGWPLYAVVGMLVAAVALVLVLTRHGTGAAVDHTSGPQAVPTAAEQPVQPPDNSTPEASPTDGAGETAVPSDQPSTPDGEAAALDSLQQTRASDLATVQLDGSYVAQLASKTVGIVDPYQTAANGSHTFYAADILAEHLQLRQGDNLGARVVLLLSTDYGRQQLYQGQPLWVTFALASFGSAPAVTAWCARRFPQLSGTRLTNQCTARQLEPVGG